MLPSQISACRRGGFKVLQIDATYVINDVRWPLTLIMCIDNEGKHQLLAQMLSCHERYVDVNWMLAHFKSNFRGDVEVVITDRGQSYAEPIKERFPTAKHLYCVHHLKANIRKRCKELGLSSKSEEVEKSFIASVYAGSQHDFDQRRRRLYDTILQPLLPTLTNQTTDDHSDGNEDEPSSAASGDHRSSRINIHDMSDDEEDGRVPSTATDASCATDDRLEDAATTTTTPEWWQIVQRPENANKPEVYLVMYLYDIYKLKEHFAGYITSDLMTCGAWSTQAIESLHHAIKYSCLRDLKHCTLARIVELIDNYVSKAARKHSWVVPSEDVLKQASTCLSTDMLSDFAPFLDLLSKTCTSVVSKWMTVECVEAYRRAAVAVGLEDATARKDELPTRLRSLLEDCTSDPMKAMQHKWFEVRPRTRPNQRPRVIAFNTTTGAFRCSCHRPTRNGHCCRHLIAVAMQYQEVFLLPQHIHHRYWCGDIVDRLKALSVIFLHRRATVHEEPCVNYQGNYPLDQWLSSTRSAVIQSSTRTENRQEDENFTELEKRKDSKGQQQRRSSKQQAPYATFQAANDMRPQKRSNAVNKKVTSEFDPELAGDMSQQPTPPNTTAIKSRSNKGKTHTVTEDRVMGDIVVNDDAFDATEDDVVVSAATLSVTPKKPLEPEKYPRRTSQQQVTATREEENAADDRGEEEMPAEADEGAIIAYDSSSELSDQPGDTEDEADSDDEDWNEPAPKATSTKRKVDNTGSEEHSGSALGKRNRKAKVEEMYWRW